MEPRHSPGLRPDEAYRAVRDGYVADAAIADATGAGMNDPIAINDEAVDDSSLAPPFINPVAGAGVAAERAPLDVAATNPWGAPAAAGESNDQVAAELAGMRELLQRIALRTVDDRIDAGSGPLQEARSRLLDQGVGPSIMIPVLDQVADAIVGDATPRMVLQTLQRKLLSRLPETVSLNFGRLPLAIFIGGPSGSGKTTLAVRLAMEIAANRGLRVALAGVDVSRAGAPQQLAACGAAVGVPVRHCYSPGELKALLDEGTADVVVVDTPASDGTRRDRTAEIKAFTQVASHRTSLLTLPASMKDREIGRVAQNFVAHDIDGLVLTRCDETQLYGALLTAAVETQIGIAYSSHGGELRDPLQPGDNQAIALAVVAGRWPHRSEIDGLPVPTVRG